MLTFGTVTWPKHVMGTSLLARFITSGDTCSLTGIRTGSHILWACYNHIPVVHGMADVQVSCCSWIDMKEEKKVWVSNWKHLFMNKGNRRYAYVCMWLPSWTLLQKHTSLNQLFQVRRSLLVEWINVWSLCWAGKRRCTGSSPLKLLRAFLFPQ